MLGRFPSSLRGASSRNDPEGGAGEWRPAAAARNRGLGRSGTPPARHDDLAARSSLYGSGGNAGDGSAAPGRKSPRWSAERRASRVMGRAAPRRVRIGRASPARQQNKCACRRSAHPLLGWTERKARTRAQQRTAGTNNAALFDIVREEAMRRLTGQLVSRVSAARPGTQGDTSGSRFAIFALGPRKSGLPDLRAFAMPISGRPEIGVSLRSRKGARAKRARDTRPHACG